MIGVTADTNFYVSSLVFADIPRQFVQAAEDGKFQLAISEPLIAELREVLVRRFAWSQDEVAETLSQLAGCTTLMHPTQIIDAVPADPDDNRVLECAVQAGSGYIVTGDNDLLRLGSYGGISILRVADFLRLLPTL